MRSSSLFASILLCTIVGACSGGDASSQSDQSEAGQSASDQAPRSQTSPSGRTVTGEVVMTVKSMETFDKNYSDNCRIVFDVRNDTKPKAKGSKLNFFPVYDADYASTLVDAHGEQSFYFRGFDDGKTRFESEETVKGIACEDLRGVRITANYCGTGRASCKDLVRIDSGGRFDVTFDD